MIKYDDLLFGSKVFKRAVSSFSSLPIIRLSFSYLLILRRMLKVKGDAGDLRGITRLLN